ncbi:MAG: hypothetical protein ACO1SX_00890 [Actinomycetota bacterium]
MYRKLRKLLKRAQKAEMLVRVRRSVERGWATGYVLDVGRKWLLMAVIWEANRYDGFEVVRLRDISELEGPGPQAEFIERALKLRGIVKPAKPPISLASTRELLETASAAFPLVTVHREHIRRGACWIGEIQTFKKKRFVLRTIGTDARWDDDDLAKFRYSGITRVDVGAEYEASLQMVAADAARAPL